MERTGAGGPPVDVQAVARFVGLAVRFVPGPQSFSGRLIRERYLIEVNAAHHPHRQRFTIGHELGHFELKHNNVVCVQDDRSWNDPTRINERQASEFAAELLMPAQLVRSSWQELAQNKVMAERFNVSAEAMWRRLEALDLLGLDRRI